MLMKAKKPLIMAGVGTVVGLAAFAGVASAQTPQTDTGGQQSLASKIAAKFNLKESDVQAVFDEDHAAHEVQMQQRLDDKLTQAVNDGKITADQKTTIIDKLKAMKDYKALIADKSGSEQRELMKTKFDEIRQWAEANGLADYLPMGGPGHMMKGSPMNNVKGGITDTTNN
jgi:hypothetical protein